MEIEVFSRIGAWKSYEELEESLSINELIESANALKKQDREAFRASVIATHGEDPFKEEEVQLTVGDIARRALGPKGGDDTVNAMNADLAMDGMISAFGYSVEE
jgi:hypothetical protein